MTGNFPLLLASLRNCSVFVFRKQHSMNMKSYFAGPVFTHHLPGAALHRGLQQPDLPGPKAWRDHGPPGLCAQTPGKRPCLPLQEE